MLSILKVAIITKHGPAPTPDIFHLLDLDNPKWRTDGPAPPEATSMSQFKSSIHTQGMPALGLRESLCRLVRKRENSQRP